MKPEGYIDLQVNGYAGVDFNDPGTPPDRIHAAARQLRADGTDHILATVITAPPERMTACLRNLVRARAGDALTRSVITGLHVEGPFLHAEAGYIGAHPLEAACDATRDRAAPLLEAGDGLVRLFTLAPERDPAGDVTRFLAEQGIRVSAGHTDASLDALHVAIENGLTLFTHLGNGCPLLVHRHDNILQRALSFRARLRYGLIADGVHLPLFVLRNIIDLVGEDRCFIVSDAMAAAGLGPGRYSLGGQTVEVDETLSAWSADRSHLVGSAAPLHHAAALLRKASFSADVIRKLTVDNPARLLNT